MSACPCLVRVVRSSRPSSCDHGYSLILRRLTTRETLHAPQSKEGTRSSRNAASAQVHAASYANVPSNVMNSSAGSRWRTTPQSGDIIPGSGFTPEGLFPKRGRRTTSRAAFQAKIDEWKRANGRRSGREKNAQCPDGRRKPRTRQVHGEQKKLPNSQRLAATRRSRPQSATSGAASNLFVISTIQALQVVHVGQLAARDVQNDYNIDFGVRSTSTHSRTIRKSILRPRGVGLQRDDLAARRADLSWVPAPSRRRALRCGARRRMESWR